MALIQRLWRCRRALNNSHIGLVKSMTTLKDKFKTVYVLTQFPNLASAIQTELPDIEVKRVKIRADYGVFIWDMPIGKEEISDLAEAEILVADNNLIPKVLYQMPNMKWIQSTWAGIELILAEVKKHSEPPSFPVTRFSGPSFGQIMGEYVLAQVINHERAFFDHYVNAKLERKWIKDVSWDYRSTNEITLAILGGCGAIGSYIAKMFDRINTRVTGYGRQERSQDFIKSIPLAKYSTKLEDILPDCDYVLSVLPSTPDTIGLLNGDKLQLCAKKKPVFINLGRGSLIDEMEIIRALDNNWISYAILDVFKQEPLPKESPLWTHDKVLITPHIAAISRPKDVVKGFVENFHRFVAGQKMNYEIDWRSGY